MAFGIFGKKCGMTQVFTESGEIVTVTIIKVEPNQITGIKTPEKNGYSAIQIGLGERKKNRVNKPLAGQYEYIKKESGVEITPKQMLKEIRLDDISAYKVGDIIGMDAFKADEVVDVQAKSKGRGFQGVMKKYGFAGGYASHGSQWHRGPGATSIIKGVRMPSRMGDKQVTIKNLKIFSVDLEKNRILIRGSVPGGKRAVVFIRKQGS